MADRANSHFLVDYHHGVAKEFVLHRLHFKLIGGITANHDQINDGVRQARCSVQIDGLCVIHEDNVGRRVLSTESGECLVYFVRAPGTREDLDLSQALVLGKQASHVDSWVCGNASHPVGGRCVVETKVEELVAGKWNATVELECVSCVFDVDTCDEGVDVGVGVKDEATREWVDRRDKLTGFEDGAHEFTGG